METKKQEWNEQLEKTEINLLRMIEKDLTKYAQMHEYVKNRNPYAAEWAMKTYEELIPRLTSDIRKTARMIKKVREWNVA